MFFKGCRKTSKIVNIVLQRQIKISSINRGEKPSMDTAYFQVPEIYYEFIP